MLCELHLNTISPLRAANQLNHTQLWQARLSENTANCLATTSFHLPSDRVVIKQLSPNYNEQQYQDFCQEYQCLLACQSLALTAQRDYGITAILPHEYLATETETDNKNTSNIKPPYFIMPYYAGNTLKALLIREHLNLCQKIAFAIKICQLLDAIHYLGYLYCDLKPANLLITSYQQIVLLDFGLAQPIVAHTVNEPYPTAYTAGTPAYMSPEQFNGLPLTPQSDYYNLGIVLFELLAGYTPYQAQTIRDFALAHCQAPLPCLPRLTNNTATQQTLQTIINGLIAKLPTKRFTTLNTVIASLQALDF